jgi:hypothetical protein
MVAECNLKDFQEEIMLSYKEIFGTASKGSSPFAFHTVIRSRGTYPNPSPGLLLQNLSS